MSMILMDGEPLVRVGYLNMAPADFEAIVGALTRQFLWGRGTLFFLWV